MYITQVLLAVLLVFMLDTIRTVNGVAVMSVDLGTEWMKVGIVSPGVPMEIALNKESKRKTPAVISFRDNMRTFGEDAQTIGIRFPKNSYGYLLDLLGKDIRHPLVQLYKSRFPYYEIIEDAQRGTILFKHDDETTYSPEELVAQFLNKAREFAEQSAGQPIKECVITVPGYFNQAERKAILQAAQLANVKVLQLINDYTAIALNYGIFRIKDFNETAQYVMFYDMGASKTTATVVSYQTVKTKERGYVETIPQLSVIGVGYDRTLGGLEIQLRLRDYLAKKFNELKLTPNDVTKNPRAFAKLFKEAGRLKTILSANADHYAQVEGLLDEKDFKLLVTREELENLCSDLFDRVSRPVEHALKTAGLTMDVIGQVIIVGGGTRVPKIQEKLQQAVGKYLAKNLNADEAATMGAVYKAADLSTGFKVKKFITKDAVLFPIQVVFERTSENGIKQVKRTLFGHMNPYPQKKIITFNKHTSDFTFNVNYAELDFLPPEEILNLGSLNLTEVSLNGVSDAVQKNTGDNVESKGIKAHFAMDDSGVLNMINVEFVVEKTITENEEAEEESPLSKLGSTISKLFSGNEESVKKDEQPASEDGEKTNTNGEKSEGKSEKSDAVKNETETKSNATAKDDKPKETKPKIVVLKEPIKSQEKVLAIDIMSNSEFDESMKKLEKLNAIDKEINRRASALNNLESFAIDTQGKLDTDEYISASTDKELEEIRTMCSEISEWLYDDGSDADANTYEKKLSDLKILTRDLNERVFEHRERPEALKALKSMLNGSIGFLDSAKNLTKANNPEKDIYTEVEIETLQKVINETIEWRDKMVEEQKNVKKSEPVKLTVRMITEKMALLDREVKYLVNKLKIWKPKKVEKPKEEEKPEEEQIISPEENKDGAAEDQAEQVEIVEETPEEMDVPNPSKVDETEKSHSEL